jgi:hypothetical protein
MLNETVLGITGDQVATIMRRQCFLNISRDLMLAALSNVRTIYETELAFVS